MSTQHTIDLTAKLQLAGRAIYRPHVWKDGNSSQGELVAQVYAEGDRDLPECVEFLNGDVRLLGNDNQANAYAQLFVSAPKLLAFAKWAARQLQGDSGAGHNYWEQFPEYLAGLAAIAKATGVKP